VGAAPAAPPTEAAGAMTALAGEGVGQSEAAGERIVIFGNSGSGKSTLARHMERTRGLARLDLDLLAWSTPGRRRPLDDSAAEITAFLDAHAAWVVEGCYGDLVELVVPVCTTLWFLNPGVEACIAHCRTRPWEPEKHATPEAQDGTLAFLIEWVRAYPERDDEYSLSRHRHIFDAFRGVKREFTSPVDVK